MRPLKQSMSHASAPATKRNRFTTVEEALEYFKESGCRIAFVDVNLGGESGLEFCRKLRELPGGEIPVIIVVTSV